MAADGRRVPLHAMVPTPFTEDGSAIDADSLTRLATTMIDRGCDGVVALGVIAEPASLTLREQIQTVEVLSAAVPDAELTLTLMSLGSQAGAAAAEELVRRTRDSVTSVMVPVTDSDPDVLRRDLIRAHEWSRAPLIVQDFPASNGVHIAVDDLASAVADLDFVTAIRCQAPPAFFRMQQLRDRTEVPVMSGFGGVGLVDELLSGSSGVVCGISRPEVIAHALRAWERGDIDRARALTAELSPLIHFETQAKTSIGIRKEHWRLQGVIASSTVRPPTIPYQASFRRLSALHGFDLDIPPSER